MTPEERWTKIENALETASETLATVVVTQQEHSKQIQELTQAIADTNANIAATNTNIRALDKRLSSLAAAHEGTERALEKLITRMDRHIEEGH
jgi:chromosome segregation ATPase